MDDRLKQLLVAAPSLVAGLRGNGTATQAFMEGYQRTLAQLQQQQALTGQQAIQSAQFQQASDRQAMLDRERQEDRALAMEDRKRRLGLESLGMIPTLGEIGSMAETPEAAQSTIESIMPRILEAFGPEALAVGQPAVDLARANITGRQRKQVSDFVESAMKLDVIADNPDNDPEFTQLPAHIQRIVGKPTARLSELQTLAQQPVGRPSRGSGRALNREELALRAAQGDKEAERALRLLREPVSGDGLPRQEWVIRDGVPTPIPQGTARPGDRPYEKGTTGEPGGPSEYSVDRSRDTVRKVDDLLPRINQLTAGVVGSTIARLPMNTEARNVSRELESLAASVAFDQLTRMREASKTGGALGQVSNMEIGLLQNAVASIRQDQSPENLVRQLRLVRESAQRFLAAAGMGDASAPGRTQPDRVDELIRKYSRPGGQ